MYARPETTDPSAYRAAGQVDEWSEKVMAAEAAASGEPAAHQPLTCPHCQGAVDLQAGQLVAHQPWCIRSASMIRARVRWASVDALSTGSTLHPEAP